MGYPKVIIIILNWNGWRDTIECLESIYHITYPNYEVIVIDNGSEDDSIKMIKSYCYGKLEVTSNFFKYDPTDKPIDVIEYTSVELGLNKNNPKTKSNKKITIIKNKHNYGFAEGNNIGVRFALGNFDLDYVLLLNNDTVVDRAFLDELITVAEKDKQIGILNPIFYYYNNPSEIQFRGKNIDWCGPICQFLYERGKNKGRGPQIIVKTEIALGACMLIKNTILEKVGLLSPEYFYQAEDTDYSIRTSRKGYKIVCVSNSKVWHKVSVSLNKVSWNKVRYLVRNRFILRSKYATLFQLVTFTISFVTLEAPIYMFYYLVFFRDLRVVEYLLKGFKEGLIYTMKQKINA